MRYLFAIFITLLSLSGRAQIIDSNITLSEALEGTTAPSAITSRLVIVDVEYYSIDSLLHRGQIVVDSTLRSEVAEIFEYIKSQKIIVEMVIPISFDLPDGNTTMAHLNNTYGFHYRVKAGGKKSLSNHSYGTAIDFNPFDNPYISKSGRIIPKGAEYNPAQNPLSLSDDSKLVMFLKSRGWTWGGDWRDPKDYMHFEKH